MPVDTPHPQYDDALKKWERCRDAFEGTDAIKGNAATYLPPLSPQMKSNDYKHLVDRALWFGATERTVKGLAGAVMRKPVQVEVPTLMEDELNDVTLTGVPLQSFCYSVIEDMLAVGRTGVLIDMPVNGTRPYLVQYNAEDIVNWRTQRFDGEQILTLLVLRETALQEDQDEFGHEAVERYRVLRLGPPEEYEDWFYATDVVSNSFFKYTQQVYIKVKRDGQEEWEPQFPVLPLKQGEPLDRIPFTLFNATSLDLPIEKPPLLDLVDHNLSHFKNSADHERSLYFCGAPAWFFKGIPAGTEIVLGSSRAIISEHPDADGKIIEANANAVGALREALQQKERKLSVLGAALLDEPKKAAEAAETLRIRQASGQATLRAMAQTGSDGMERVFKLWAEWEALDPDAVSLRYNNDFVDATLTPEQIRVYLEMLIKGAISRQTFYSLLEGGELTRPGVTYEEELAAIEKDRGEMIQDRQNGQNGNISPQDQQQIQNRVLSLL